MASEKKTANYKLNKWSRTDGVNMDDFNSDNDKIDAAIGKLESKANIISGSYIGTGTYGPANPTSITFDFVPQLVFVIQNGGTTGTLSCNANLLLVRGTTRYSIYGNDTNYKVNVTWSGKTVSYYSDYSAESMARDMQMNTSGFTYRYLAIG